MPQELTIHVGYTKTGTTTLQNSCFSKLPENVFLCKYRNGMVDWLNEFRTILNYGKTAHVLDNAQRFSGHLSKYGEHVLISLEDISNPLFDTDYFN